MRPLVRKAQQRLYFLRKLNHAHLPHHLLTNFYRSAIESILTYCCTLHRGEQAGSPLLDIYTGRLGKKATDISKDHHHHPGHYLFSPLPSGRRFRTIKTKTNRLRNSFDPQAVTAITPEMH
ncbi:hypothetical protein N1851_008497 [Merluccius polli]|uniref:Alkylated DNA repair protein AlkB homologue 8 N-terminal domain-containing protein n=1 Tax=Merluccius polli TaxID=89951 RepID=A0AA47N112_MERPO|nr:hypothetical protein N1851_008497 [Merluccius polli]